MAPSRLTTAANEEICANWVTISDKAPRIAAKADIDWVMRPNSTSPRM